MFCHRALFTSRKTLTEIDTSEGCFKTNVDIERCRLTFTGSFNKSCGLWKTFQSKQSVKYTHRVLDD